MVKETGRVIQLGNLIPDTENFKNKQAGRVYSINGISAQVNGIKGETIGIKEGVGSAHP